MVKTTNKNLEEEAKKIEQEELEETKEEEKETFENGKKKSVFKRIWNFIFWLAIICLFAIWITDFVRTKREEKPIFCIKEVEHKYDDGTTTECDGLGYKVFTYKRESIKLKSQFSPFFVSMEE